MSTDITTTSTSTSLVKRAGLIALFAVLALLMGAKFSGALISGPASSGHSSTAAYTYASNATYVTAVDTYGTGAITVNWYDSDGSVAGITGYNIVADAAGASNTALAADTPLCSTTGAGPISGINLCTFTPATALTGKSLYVIAVNPTYGNLYSTGTALSAPGAVTLSSSAGAQISNSGNIKVSWSTNSNGTIGGSNALANTKYVVYNGANAVCTVAGASSTSCTFSVAAAGLTVGGSYSFTVSAVNAATATASANATNTITVGTGPTAPTGVSATVNYSKSVVVVAWTAPTTTGGGSVSYTVLDNAGNAMTCASSTTTSCTIAIGTSSMANLTAASSYVSAGTTALPYNNVFTVLATNSAGQVSTAVTSVVSIVAMPTAPQAASATSLVLSGTTGTANWAAPASNTSLITGYAVQLLSCTSALASSCAVSGSPVYVGAGVTSNAFRGLTPGTYYNFTVAAVSAAGTGPILTGAANQLVVAAAPAAAGMVVSLTQTTNSSFTISWNPPPVTNGSPVTGYVVQGIKCTTDATCGSPTNLTTKYVSATTTSYTWTGLTVGNYSATVAAQNASGSNGGAATGTPVAITVNSSGVAVTNGSTYVGLSLNAPSVFFNGTSTTISLNSTPFASATNSASVEKYSVSSFTVYNTSTGATICTATYAAGSCTSTAKITTGTVLAVYATDANGVSSTDAVLSAVTAPVATSPTTITAVSDDAGNVLLSWTAAASGTGQYVVQAVGKDGTSFTTTVTQTATQLATSAQPYSFTVIPAAKLTSSNYTFYVTAVNAVGATALGSPYTDLANNVVSICSATDVCATVAAGSNSAYGAAPAPTNVSATILSGTSLSFSWTAPGASTKDTFNTGVNFKDQAGYPTVTGYIGTLTATIQGTTFTCVSTTASCTFTGLTQGQKYTFSVVTTTVLALANSAATTAVSATPAAVPGSPTITSASPINSSGVVDGTTVKVTVAAPAVPGLVALNGVIGSSSGSGFSGSVGDSAITIPTYASAASTYASTLATYGASSPYTLGAQLVAGIAKAIAGGTPLFVVGEAISGTGIAADTYVTSVSSTSIGLSAALTAGVTAATLITGSAYIIKVSDATTTAIDGTHYCTTVLTALGGSCTVSLLLPGDSYVISAYAVSAVGKSTAATTSFATATVPNAPTGVTATSSSTTAKTVILSWTAPTNNGGSAITGYTISAYTSAGAPLSNGWTDGATNCVDAVTLSHTITGTAAACTLSQANTGIVFGVVATNSVTAMTEATVGTGVATTAITSSPLAFSNAVSEGALPLTPVVTVTADASTLLARTVAWTLPSPYSDLTITSYVVKAVGGTEGTVSVTLPATATNYTFADGTAAGNLTYGISYTFTVTAVSAYGSSVTAVAVPYSSTANAVSAPQNVQVNVETTSQSAQATGFVIQWTKPASAITGSGRTSGMPITYNVIGTAGGSVVFNTTTSGYSASFPVAGLSSTVITGYSFTVTATDGFTSYAANAVAGSTTANYNATVPTANATVTAATDGSASGHTTANTVTLTVTGVAASALGSSTVALAGQGSNTVTFTDASGKTYSCNTGVNTLVNTSGTSTCEINGLAANTAYTYSVSTSNAYGAYAVPASGVVVTAATNPGTPTGVTVTPVVSYTGGVGYESFLVSWTAPTTTGGSPITGYTVAVSTNPSLTTDTTTNTYCQSSSASTATSCLITGAGAANLATIIGSTALTGYGYYVFVSAVNAAGLSSVSAGTIKDVYGIAQMTTSADTATAPIVGPLYVDVQTTAVGSLAVKWTASSPARTTALPVTGYIVVASGSLGDIVTCSTTTATTCTLTGLQVAGDTYTINVYAQNAVSNAAATAALQLGTAASSCSISDLTGKCQSGVVTWSGWTAPTVAPGIATAVSLVSGTATVIFAPPVQSPYASNGAPISKYTVTATDSTGNVVGTPGAVTASTAVPGASQVTITGLTAGSTYTISVYATNAIGDSPVSTVSVKSISGTNPSAVTGLSAVRNATGFAVTWTAPASLGSAAQLVGYWVTATDPLTGQQYTCPYNATYGVLLAPAVTCSILGLTVGTTYTVSVTAIAIDGAMTKLLSAATTATATYNTLAPEPVMATFLAVTAKQKSVSALSSAAKTALASLISSTNDGAQITITGYGTTKTIALARANAAASYLFNNGAAIHVTIKSVVSKTIKTALVTVTSN